MLVRQAQIDASTQMVTEQRQAWGRAYREGTAVCDRVHVTIGRDGRLGLARHERHHVSARFVGWLHPALRADLVALLRRRGAAARRVAEATPPIELVFEDAQLGRISGYIEPPQLRYGKLRELEFGLRESVR